MVFLMLSLFYILLPQTAQAVVCPVCTVAVCASVGLSRWLGVDDTITGLWIGGLTISLIAWTIDYLNKKNIRFYGRKILTAILYYLMIVWPLYYFNLAGNPNNMLWGMDKLVLGITVGSIIFIGAVIFNNFLKKKNQNKVYFPFQKVVIPFSSLLATSLIFYLICYLQK